MAPEGAIFAGAKMGRMTDSITFTRPDDWHLHLRDGAALQAVVAHTARQFRRAIVMPNLRPPVTTAAMAVVPWACAACAAMWWM